MEEEDLSKYLFDGGAGENTPTPLSARRGATPGGSANKGKLTHSGGGGSHARRTTPGRSPAALLGGRRRLFDPLTSPSPPSRQQQQKEQPPQQQQQEVQPQAQAAASSSSSSTSPAREPFKALDDLHNRPSPFKAAAARSAKNASGGSASKSVAAAGTTSPAPLPPQHQQQALAKEGSPAPSVATFYYLSSDSDDERPAADPDSAPGSATKFFFPEDEEELVQQQQQQQQQEGREREQAPVMEEEQQQRQPSPMLSQALEAEEEEEVREAETAVAATTPPKPNRTPVPTSSRIVEISPSPEQEDKAAAAQSPPSPSLPASLAAPPPTPQQQEEDGEQAELTPSRPTRGTPRASRRPPATPPSQLLPASPMLPPPESVSVEGLLRRAHAVRTPEVAGPGKVQSWLSERMMSAVKRFVFKGTEGGYDIEDLDDAAAAAALYYGGGGGNEPATPTLLDTSSLAVQDGTAESIEGDDDESDDDGHGATPGRLDVSELASPEGPLLPHRAEQVEAPFSPLEDTRRAHGHGRVAVPTAAAVAAATPVAPAPAAVSTDTVERSRFFRQDAVTHGGYLAPRLSAPVGPAPSLSMQPRVPAAPAPALARSGPVSAAAPMPLSSSSSSSSYPLLARLHAGPAAPPVAPTAFTPTKRDVRASNRQQQQQPSYRQQQHHQQQHQQYRAWGAGAACSVHLPTELRDDDMQPGARAAAEAMVRQALRGGQVQQEQQQQRGQPMLTVLAMAEEGGRGIAAATPAPAPAARPAGKGAPAAARLPHLYSPPLVRRRRPVAGNEEGDAEQPLASSQGSNSDDGDNGLFYASRSLSTTFLPAARTAMAMATAPAASAATTAASTAAQPAEATATGFVTSVPVTWRKLRVGGAASRELQLRHCGGGSRGPCSVQAAIVPDPDDAVEVAAGKQQQQPLAFELDGGVAATEATIGEDGLLRLNITFHPRSPGMHRAVLAIAVTPTASAASSTGASARRFYEVKLSGLASGPSSSSSSFSASASSSQGFKLKPKGWAAKKKAAATESAEDDAFSISGDSVLSMTLTASRAQQALASANAAARGGGSHKGAGGGGAKLRPTSVFFAAPILEFGAQSVGAVCVRRVQLCNPLDVPQLVVIQPVSLPFVLLHQSIRLKPKSFVQLPVRFIPVAAGSFAATMHAAVHPITPEGEEEEQEAEGFPARRSSYGIVVELRGEGRAS